MNFLGRILRNKPSPAMVVATVALIVALGGTSYAATQLSKNSVGTPQIKKNAVTTAKIKKNAVNAAKLRKNSVTSAKVKDRSLTARDFQANSLPRGPRGATGPAGPIEGTPAGGDLSGIFPNPSLDAPSARARAATVVTPGPPALGQAIPSGGQGTAVELDTEQFDTGDMYLAPDNVITVKKAGTYSITGQLGWQGDVNGARQLRIMAGGSLTALDQASPGTDGNIRQTVNSVARLAPGDTISLVAFQNSGTELSTVVNAGQIGGAWLAATWVGP